METAELDILRYPTGKFVAPENFSEQDIQKWITNVEELPNLLRNELASFTDEMQDTPYRDGGWSARQVVHHVADSHMNAYIRFKLALTEDSPVIKPYQEKLWSELPDAKTSPCEISLDILDALHRRWIMVLRKMKGPDFERKFINPETKREFRLGVALALYSWHGLHHLGHLRIVKRKFVTAK
jgi:hypothetical protein